MRVNNYYKYLEKRGIEYMNIKHDLKRLVKNPLLIVPFLGRKKFLSFMSDEIYLKIIFRAKMDERLNLDNPKTFNEKLQYLKLYNRKPLYTNLVDKYKVREYISRVLGDEYLVGLLGVWDKFEEINFSKLPNQFALKTTHGSGGVLICMNKKKFDIESARKIINASLNSNYFYLSREWPYKNVKPRIICEELIETNDGSLPDDYKFSCFNGHVDNVMVATERNIETGKAKFFFFDKEWNLLRYNKDGINAPKDFTLPKLENMSKMFEIAEILAKNIPFVRVDLYSENNKIYFGEMTFFPGGGMDDNLIESTDILFGEKLQLQDIYK